MLTAPDFKQKQILFAFLSRNEKVIFKNDNIIVQDAEGTIKHQSSCYRLFILFVVGHMSVTTGLLQRAEKFGFNIVFMTHGLHVYGSWVNKANGNVLLRAKQYNYTSLGIAQHLVKNKIENQLCLLKRIREKCPNLKMAIQSVKKVSAILPDASLNLKEILGIEGMAAKTYFQNIFSEYKWTTRRPRVKHDITNCLLDIGYTLLFNFIEGLVTIYGFDIYQGIYHRQFYNRKSLICDLVEPFRPLIDWRIRNAHSLGQVKEKDFDERKGQYFLSSKKALPYVNFLLETLVEEKDDIFKYIQAYYRAFMKNKPAKDFPCFMLKE
ncbi:MAG: type V CRISPR-associated endonuclease Cas1 [Candidatus Omnitrophica bacterium]|jgi:CRISPR-associated protein Cas1|nr:type V CRISPR-associated endonuclease Cas1 [Candidatus Omnitrophota bacterium]